MESLGRREVKASERVVHIARIKFRVFRDDTVRFAPAGLAFD